MGFRRAKSTQGNTNCQKNIFAVDQVPGHHPRALTQTLSILLGTKGVISKGALRPLSREHGKAAAFHGELLGLGICACLALLAVGRRFFLKF